MSSKKSNETTVANLPPDISLAINALYDLACEATTAWRAKYHLSFSVTAEPWMADERGGSLFIDIKLPGVTLESFDFHHSLKAHLPLGE